MTTSCVFYPLLLACFFIYGVHSSLTVTPSNTVAVVGDQNVALKCSSNSTSGSNAIFWYFETFSTSPIVSGCVAVTSDYSVNSTTAGNCDLIINTVTASLAASYLCTDSFAPDGSAYANLVVLNSDPVCSSNGTYVVENDLVSMSCDVGYTQGPTQANTHMTATMTWSGSSCSSSTPFVNTSYALSAATVNAQPPTLSSCTCTTSFTAPVTQPPNTVPPNMATNAPTYNYTWSSPTTVLSYCPNNTTITPDGGDVLVSSPFLCSSDAYPPVSSYNWIIITGAGTAVDDVFTLTSVGQYNISCEATNYLFGGTNSPCSGSAYVTGTSNDSALPDTTPSLTTATSPTTVIPDTCPPDTSPPDTSTVLPSATTEETGFPVVAVAVGVSVGVVVIVIVILAVCFLHPSCKLYKKDPCSTHNQDSPRKYESQNGSGNTASQNQTANPPTSSGMMMTQPSGQTSGQQQHPNQTPMSPNSSQPPPAVSRHYNDDTALIYADLARPGEANAIVNNRPGSRQPVQTNIPPENLYGVVVNA